MKKNLKLMIIIAIVVVAIIGIIGIVVLTSVSKKNQQEKVMSKEEMLEVAEELKFNEVVENMKENQIRAQEKYIENIYKFNCFVSSIENNYIIYQGDENEYLEMKIYLNDEELKKINKGDGITIVGKINNLGYSKKTSMMLEYIECEVKNAYVISEDTLEITGTINGIKEKKLTAYTYSLPNNIVCERLERHGEFTDIIYGDDQWECKIYTNEGAYDLTDCVPKKNRKFKDEGKTTIDNVKVENGDKVTIVGKAKEEHGIKKITEIKLIKKVK